MTSAFYNDDKILQDQLTEPVPLPTLTFSLEESFDISYTTNCILTNNYKKIALQFPDELLSVAPAIVARLKKELSKNPVKRYVYILGDTSYGACCVDEVAAQHMNADFIVHYGRACMSRTTRLPVLYVFGKKKIDVPQLVQTITREFTPETKLLIFYDVGYYYAIPDLEKSVLDTRGGNTVFAKVEKESKKQFHLAGREAKCISGGCMTCDDESISCRDGNCCESSCPSEEQTSQTTNSDSSTNTDNQTTLNTADQSTSTTQKSIQNTTDESTTNTDNQSTNTLPQPTANTTDTATSINGRSFELIHGTSLQDYTFLYIGEEDATLTNVMMTNNKSQFYTYNPETAQLKKQSDMNRNLIRRYHYIEKARDAEIIGIVVATLGVEGYMEVIERMKSIIKAAEKKSYLIVVGKLNEFKLGNFQEIDIFVIVACNENTIIDSKNYYKPVITPFELEIALVRGKEWTGEYRTDFEHILQDAEPTEAPEESSVRFSLNSQKVMKNPKHIEIEVEGSTDLATRNNNVEMVTTAFATSYLASRSWRGLEQHIGETPVSAPVEGRSGIASVYEGEPQ